MEKFDYNLTDYNRIEIHLEKARHFFNGGLEKESFITLKNFIEYYSKQIKTDKEKFCIISFFESELAIFYVTLGKFTQALEVISKYDNYYVSDINNYDLRLLALNHARAFFQINQNNLDQGLKIVSDSLDLLESYQKEKNVNSFFLRERIAYSEFLIALGYWMKGNLHIANEFCSSSIKKFALNQSVRLLQALNLQGTILRLSGDYTSSKEILERAILLSLVESNQRIQPFLLNNL
ncbi:MAG: hypothetical protein ACFFD1_01435, partial [Candidatus Thorarchaeota archaeon]